MAKKPAILKRLVRQLEARGYKAGSAYPIAVSQLQKAGDLKKGSTEATAQGKKRGAMTPKQRATARRNRNG